MSHARSNEALGLLNSISISSPKSLVLFFILVENWDLRLTTAVLLLFCIIHSSLPPDALPATCLAVTSLKTAYAVGSLLQTNWKPRAPTSYSRKFTVAGLRRGVTPWTFRKVISLMYWYAAKQLPRSLCKCIQLEFSFSKHEYFLSVHKIYPKTCRKGEESKRVLWLER